MSEVKECGYDIDVGWYDNTEWGNWGWDTEPVPTCYNYVQLEPGEAVLIQPSTTKGGLIFNGQVATDDIEVKGNAMEKTYRCNCSPVKISLGQIKPNANFFPQTDLLTIMSATGGNKGQYVYIDEQLVKEVKDCGYDIEVGWYENVEWGNWGWDTEPVPT